jgi:hypothetical protein
MRSGRASICVTAQAPAALPASAQAQAGSQVRQRSSTRRSEAPGREGRAPDRAALVGAEQGGGRGARVGGEQRRHQDQPAAADDGVDAAGQQRGEGDEGEFGHGGREGCGAAQRRAPVKRAPGVGPAPFAFCIGCSCSLSSGATCAWRGAL